MQLRVSLLLSPQIERHRSDLIDHRLRQSALCHVDCLDVDAASVARFHANMLEFFGGIYRKLSGILLPASGANESSKLPFRQTK